MADKQDSSEICEFYSGRSVFITGSTGNIGAILLETLLRCCPGIVHIFVLVRRKKGLEPEARREKIFQKIIFSTLKKENPAAFDKVKTVIGDISEDRLGLNDSDLEALKEHVSIVFNCAASISFFHPAWYMISKNSVGAHNIVQLCRILPNFTALVHTSTAFSNCNMKDIEEKIYPMKISAKRFIEESKSGSDEGIQALKNQLSVPFENNYAFSKAIAENLIAEETQDLPVAIVRPSIITYCYKGPYKGYIEPGFAVGDIFALGMVGILKVINVPPNIVLDVIPADTAVNTLIISAWTVATKRMSNPLIVNCCSSKICPYTIQDIMEGLKYALPYRTLPLILQTPKFTVVGNYYKFKITEMIEHYIPGIAMDLGLLITGQQPKFVKLYKYVAELISQYAHLDNLEIFCDCENFLHLNSLLSRIDKEMFDIDMTQFNFKHLMKNSDIPIQLKGIKNKKPLKSKEAQLEAAKWNSLILNSIKFAVITTFLIILSFFINKIIGFFL